MCSLVLNNCLFLSIKFFILITQYTFQQNTSDIAAVNVSGIPLKVYCWYPSGIPVEYQGQLSVEYTWNNSGKLSVQYQRNLPQVYMYQQCST